MIKRVAVRSSGIWYGMTAGRYCYGGIWRDMFAVVGIDERLSWMV